MSSRPLRLFTRVGLRGVFGLAVVALWAGCGRNEAIADGSPPVSAIFDALPPCSPVVDVGSDDAVSKYGRGPDGSREAAPADDADHDAAADRDAGPTDGPADVPANTPSGGPQVVVISIDGLRPDALFRAPAQHILALACVGSYTWEAQTVHPSTTLPSHASMVSGVPPEVHGIFHDDDRPGFIPVPTVMSIAHQAGKRVVVVVGKSKLGQLVPPGSADVFFVAPDLADDTVIDRAISEAQAGFDPMFVHLPLVDLTGHFTGWLSPAYLQQVVATDAALARLLAVLPRAATIIVTADHGGHAFNHDQGDAEDLHIPWIVVGPGVKAGRHIHPAFFTFDTAATAAQLLGLSLPPTAIGRAVVQPWQP